MILGLARFDALRKPLHLHATGVGSVVGAGTGARARCGAERPCAGVGPRQTRVGSLPPTRAHARQPPPGLYTPRPCAIKINPRTRIAAAKGQHSTERVSTAHSHTWTTGAPAGCGSTVARARRGERRVAGMPRSARGVGPVPSVVQDQSASPRRRPLRRRPLAVRGGLPGVGRDADKRVASENLEQLRFKLSGDR